MSPKLLDVAKHEAEDAEELLELGDLEHALEKYKHATEMVRIFCMFTKNPIWFKQCKELESQYEAKLRQLKSKLQ
ncbi:MAG: hypothetical protein ACTSR8_11185 [Promethearchaeota archaeon]